MKNEKIRGKQYFYILSFEFDILDSFINTFYLRLAGMNLLHNKNMRKSLSTRIRLLLSFLMIGIYLSLGLYLLNKGWHALSKTQATGMGILLIAYALFRVFRMVRESRSGESDEEFSEK